MQGMRRLLTLASIVATFMAVLFAVSGQWRVFAATTPPPGAVYRVDTEQKLVALTFDISWGNKVPEPALETLKRLNVKKATFFLSGPWTLRHADIAKQIQTMGYEIGNHGNLHKDFSNYPDSWIRQQVHLSEKAIQQVTGVRTKLIRTPNGDFNERVLRCLNAMGYTVIQWHTDSLDWKNPGVQQITSRVLTRVVPGDIILMHASDSSKQIVDALPQIVAGLRAKGYRFVTVSELLHEAKIETKVQ